MIEMNRDTYQVNYDTHRDLSTGTLAGFLLKNGCLEASRELYGICCSKNGNDAVLYYGTDATTVSLQAYKELLAGKQISPIYCKPYHNATAEIEIIFQELFDDISNHQNISIQQTFYIETHSYEPFWSGFVWQDNDVKTVYTNGYFPNTLEQYVETIQKKCQLSCIIQKPINLKISRKKSRDAFIEEVKKMSISTWAKTVQKSLLNP